jgi:hypothetical protein
MADSDWLADPANGAAHRFQSMHGTDSCWHCDSDLGLHGMTEREAKAWAKYGGCTCMGHSECGFCKERK